MATKIDLGETYDDPVCCSEPPAKDSKPDVHYPTFYIKLTPEILKQIAPKGEAKIEYELSGVNINIRDGDAKGSCDVKVKSITPLTKITTPGDLSANESANAMEELLESLGNGNDSGDDEQAE